MYMIYALKKSWLWVVVLARYHKFDIPCDTGKVSVLFIISVARHYDLFIDLHLDLLKLCVYYVVSLIIAGYESQ